MDPLLELLAQLENLAELSDAELAQLLTDIREAAEAASADAAALSDEDLAVLEQAAEGVERIEAEQVSRAEEAEQLAQRAQAALDRIRGQDGDEGDGEGEPDEAGEGEGEPTTTPAEGEPDEGDSQEADGAQEQLAADGSPPRPARRRTPPLARVAARRPTVVQPPTRSRTAAPAGVEWSMVAAANVPGVPAGQPIRDAGQAADAMWQAVQATKGFKGTQPMKVPVLKLRAEYPDDVRLGRDPQENGRRIALAQRTAREHGSIRAAIEAAPEGIQAAGGICVPQQVRYDIPVIGSDARPVRDNMMLRFGADRGGVRTLPIPIITDVDDAVDVWTEANDQNPTDPVTKPCLTVTCPEEDETLVEAITRCLQFGEFRRRYWAEQIEAWMTLVGTRHARFAETRLLEAIGAGSTDIDVGQVLGTTRSVLAGLDRAVASYRSRWRLDADDPLVFGFPFWLYYQMRTDLARELPGSSDERLAVADAQLDAFFRSRFVTPEPFLDGEAGQVFGAQGAGPLVGWPSTVVTYLYPPGTWLFLDGGEFEIGIIRDSSLVETNDARWFGETFEGAHFHGIESMRLEFDTCPDGSTSATVDLDPCTTGS